LKPSTGHAVRDHRNAVRDRSELLSAFDRNHCPHSPESAQGDGYDEGTKYGAERDAYKESTKDFQTEHRKIANEANDARNNDKNLALLEKVLNDPRVITGFGNKTITNIDQAANLVGMSKGERAAVTAIAEKLGSGQITSQIRETNIGQGVAVRQTEAESINKSNFDLAKPLAANKAVVNLMRKAEQRIIENGEFANAYADRHSRLDQGYYSARDRWFAAHPLLTDEELANHNQINELMGQPTEPGAGSPNIGYTENGYRFKGGNPKDQSNWEKVK